MNNICNYVTFEVICSVHSFEGGFILQLYTHCYGLFFFFWLHSLNFYIIKWHLNEFMKKQSCNNIVPHVKDYYIL